MLVLILKLNTKPLALLVRIDIYQLVPQLLLNAILLSCNAIRIYIFSYCKYCGSIIFWRGFILIRLCYLLAVYVIRGQITWRDQFQSSAIKPREYSKIHNSPRKYTPFNDFTINGIQLEPFQRFHLLFLFLVFILYFIPHSVSRKKEKLWHTQVSLTDYLFRGW